MDKTVWKNLGYKIILSDKSTHLLKSITINDQELKPLKETTIFIEGIFFTLKVEFFDRNVNFRDVYLVINSKPRRMSQFGWLKYSQKLEIDYLAENKSNVIEVVIQ